MPSSRAPKRSSELTRLLQHFELLQGARAVGKRRPCGCYEGSRNFSCIDNGTQGPFLFLSGAFTGSSLGTTFHFIYSSQEGPFGRALHWKRVYISFTIPQRAKSTRALGRGKAFGRSVLLSSRYPGRPHSP